MTANSANAFAIKTSPTPINSPVTSLSKLLLTLYSNSCVNPSITPGNIKIMPTKKPKKPTFVHENRRYSIAHKAPIRIPVHLAHRGMGLPFM